MLSKELLFYLCDEFKELFFIWIIKNDWDIIDIR